MKSVAIWMSMFLAVSPLPVQGAWRKEPWGVVWSGETGQTREAEGNGGGEQAAGEYGTGAPGQTQAEAESGAVEAPRAQVQVVSGTGVQAAAPAAGPEIHAPSAVLMEASTGQVIYEKNADEQRSPASITKIMTLILIFDAIDSGKIKMSDEVVTSAYAKSMGGSQVFLEGTVIIGLNQKTFMGYRLSPIFLP